MGSSKSFIAFGVIVLFAILSVPLMSAEIPFNQFFQDNITNLTIIINQNYSQANLYLNTAGNSFDTQSIPFSFSSNGVNISGSYNFNISETLSEINDQVEIQNLSSVPYFNSFFVNPSSFLFYVLNYTLGLNMTYANNDVSVINNYAAHHLLSTVSDRHKIFTKSGTSYTAWENIGYTDSSSYQNNIKKIINETVTNMTISDLIYSILPVINRSTGTSDIFLGPIIDKVDLNYTINSIDISSVQFRNGTYIIPVTLSDGIQILVKNVNLILQGVQNPNSPPVITSTPVTQVNETRLYSYQVVATDADSSFLTYSLTQSPPWISMDSMGFVSGIAPNVSSDTVYAVIVNVSDGKSFATQTFSITVKNTDPVPDTTPPVVNIISPVNMANYTNQITSINYTASDPGLAKCWYSLDNGQTNVTTTCNNLITGISSVNGTNTWTVYAIDSAGNQASKSVTFFVNITNNNSNNNGNGGNNGVGNGGGGSSGGGSRESSSGSSSSGGGGGSTSINYLNNNQQYSKTSGITGEIVAKSPGTSQGSSFFDENPGVLTILVLLGAVSFIILTGIAVSALIRR